MAEICSQCEESCRSWKERGAPAAAEGFVPGIVYGGKEKTLRLPSIRRRCRSPASEAGRNAILSSILPVTVQLINSEELAGGSIRESSCTQTSIESRWDVAIRVTVPIHVVGEARGVKVDAGILELVPARRSRCLPATSPNGSMWHVSDLGINQSLRVVRYSGSGKVKVLEAPDQCCGPCGLREGRGGPAAAAAPVVEGEAAAPATNPRSSRRQEGRRGAPAQ